MPLALTCETLRAYTTAPAPISQAEAQAMLEERLLSMLKAELDTGEVLSTQYAVRVQGGMLEVRLQAECREEIGRFVPNPGPVSEAE